MSTFIKLTQVEYQCTTAPRREPCLVNSDKITNITEVVGVGPCAIAKWSEIGFIGGSSISVEECPEEIERRISMSV